MFGPNVVAIATSAASRPRAISIRPIRGVLKRASKMCHCAAQIDLEPAGEIHRRIHRRYADIAQIAGAVARRDIHAAAERDRQMGEVPTHAGALLIGFPGGLGRTRVLVAEGEVVVDEVADRLHASPSGRRCREQAPGDLRQSVRLAITAAEQVQQRLFRQVLHRVLRRVGPDRIGVAGVVDDGMAGKADLPGRRDDPADPIAEQIVIARDRNRWNGDKVVRHHQIGGRANGGCAQSAASVSAAAARK